MIRIPIVFLFIFGLLSKEPRTKGVLFIFYDTKCPICQKSSKRLQEMYVKFGQSVAFKAVFPIKSIKKSAIRQFNKEYNFSIPCVIEKAHTLVERYNTKTTQKVALLDNNRQRMLPGNDRQPIFQTGKLPPSNH
ncbi:redoxin domain-containing protein [Runella slithyformis]|uniref:Alkyl hydroperoxide reductase subunit C/ Thiol specific antioxidant domain-containing protein n=1 Tax=Runella slithyformis (strain ATCC 29530 / DSM 19594 / LMG 11500 / NCIMB 11436 / LSU 4) TaxID=761193 RepID=A0A7U4E5X7_RUNSL|nr:redoxin domain-containing protein [Runella slithyformis]AEI48933.1 hypothetical protein Runsl_2529 [Runella slithyformis DSM 19594]